MAAPLSKDQIAALPVSKSALLAGDLFFCAGTDAASRTIQAATKSSWSHCGVVWPVPEIAHVLFLEAVERYGVRLSPASKYLLPVDGKLYDGLVVFARCQRISPEKAKAMLAFGCGQLTDPYSTLEILRIGERILLGIGRKSVSDGWICSELAAACLQAAGHCVPRQHGYVTPADLWADPDISFLGRGA